MAGADGSTVVSTHAGPGWHVPAQAGVLIRSGESGYSKITFQNGATQYALIVLSGPTQAEIGVLTGSSETIDRVAPGNYTIYVRFGTGPNFTYERGEPFVVTESRQEHPFGYRIVSSRITIGLRTTQSGNYRTAPVDESVFEGVRVR